MKQYLLNSLLLLLVETGTALFQLPVGSSWQITLSSPPPPQPPYPAVAVIDLDLFDTPASTIATLHTHNISTICYFSAGTLETWRPDAHRFQQGRDYGLPLRDWPGEYWLDTSSANVRDIMRARIALAARKGCDGLDPDNTDGYGARTGFPLTPTTVGDYVRFLAGQAHAHDLSVGLKNSGEIMPDVIDDVAWAVNEQCVQYDECAGWMPFILRRKPVFNIEYPVAGVRVTGEQEESICDSPQRPRKFSTLLKTMQLGWWRYACPTHG